MNMLAESPARVANRPKWQRIYWGIASAALAICFLTGCISPRTHKKQLDDARLQSYQEGVEHGLSIAAEQVRNEQLTRKEVLANFKWYLETQ